MPLVLRIIALTNVWTLSVLATPSGFSCNAPGNIAYEIELGKQAPVLIVSNNGDSRQIQLATANRGRAIAEPGRPLFYNAWDKENSYALGLDFSTEVRVQYTFDKKEKKTIAALDLILGNKRIEPLECRSRGVFVSVQTISTEPPLERHARFFNDSATRQGFNGDLSEVGLLGVQAALLRVLEEKDYSSPQGQEQFAKLTATSLKSISPGSVEKLSKALKGDAAKLFKNLLQEARYADFPETLRYIAWVRQGTRARPDRNLNSVRAGFHAFSSSTLYKKPAVHSLFSERVAPFIGNLDESELRYTALGLQPDSSAFLHQLWAKAKLQAHPNVLRIVTEIEQRLEAKKFDPLEIKLSLDSFLRSDAFKDKSLRYYFSWALAPSMRQLSSRNKEDILVWYGPDALEFARTLLY
ncbi:MAG: hypothetical protein KDD51_11505 [Bdellovibrionales bacterium]|nr:hypothetical protein [Bdellovibrionales bacterium]